MTTFRGLRSVVRGRRLPAAGAFLFLGYLFANNLSPRPKFTSRTEGVAKSEGEQFLRQLTRRTVTFVSDDGREVDTEKGSFFDIRTSDPPETWNVRTATGHTPAHWAEPAWQELYLHGRWRSVSGLDELSANPSGRDFVRDPGAWEGLCRRLAVGRGPPADRSGVVPPADDDARKLFPIGLHFNPDGRFITYVVRDGRPMYESEPRAPGDGVAIDDARSGQRVATLPEGADLAVVGPGGRTAVTYDAWKNGGGQSHLTLWDLNRSQRKAEWAVPQQPACVQFSPDGRYVLADHPGSSDLVQWWDVATGRPVADIYASSPPVFLDGGRVLASQSGPDLVFHFWDVATGRELGEWELNPPPDIIMTQVAFAGDRYALARIRPERKPVKASSPITDRIASWVTERLTDKNLPTDDDRIWILDVIDRRLIGIVPGVSGAVSANGRWLATVDADGVVRVWELPVGRPWARGFAYAAAVFVGGWAVARWRRRAASGAA